MYNLTHFYHGLIIIVNELPVVDLENTSQGLGFFHSFVFFLVVISNSLKHALKMCKATPNGLTGSEFLVFRSPYLTNNIADMAYV